MRCGSSPLLAALSLTTTFAASAGAQIIINPVGPQPNGYFGHAVAASPDLNGDGLADVIIGAPGEAHAGLAAAGRVHVVSGANGVRLRTLVSPHAKAGGLFGYAVASVPDANGDGVPDILVGAPDEDADFIGAGRAYLFSGTNGVLLAKLISPGREIGGSFGYAVSGVPDTDGDGRGDLLVGAPDEDPGTSPTSCGRAYLYSGRTGSLIHKLLPPAPQAFGSFGYAVAGLGDVDGDGRGDIAVGAPRENPNGTPVNSGRVHIYSGATGLRRITIQSPGMMENGFFGTAVAGMGDADGDGWPDLVVGAPLEHPGNSPVDCGRAYIYSGRTGALRHKLLPPAPEPNGQFGISVAGVPDTNADGRADAIVGAWNEGGDRSGRAHVYTGATGARMFTIQPPAPQPNGRFGGSVAGLLDAGATFRGDFAIGASTETPPSGDASAGRAYIYRR